MKDILLFSGGIDSYVAWHFLGKPKVLFVNMGLNSNWVEEENVRDLADKHPEMDLLVTDLDLSRVPVMTETELPLRNLFLVEVASFYADKIYLISQKGETSLPDRSPDFMRRAGEFLTLLWGSKKEVDSPFFNVTKVQMVKWYVDNVGLIDELDEATVCCYRGQKFCGACSADFRKWVSLRLNGGGSHYDDLIVGSGLLEKYVRRAKEGDPTLGPERIEEILLVDALVKESK